MKHQIIRLAMVVMAFAFFACTHNNGNIGPWFGQWKMVSLTQNGSELPEYQGNIFWAFQNDIVTFFVVPDDFDRHMHLCTWTQQGDELLIDARHHDDINGQDYYSPPAILGMQPQEVNALHIEKLTSSTIILRYDSASGPMVYTLKKH